MLTFMNLAQVFQVLGVSPELNFRVALTEFEPNLFVYRSFLFLNQTSWWQSVGELDCHYRLQLT